MAYLILGTICFLALVICTVIAVVNRGRIRHGRERVLIFLNGRLLQEDIDYTTTALGVPVFNIEVAETDVVQRIRVHGTFVRLVPQDYQVRPLLQRVRPFTTFAPPVITGIEGNELARRIQEAFSPPGVSMSARSAVTPSEGSQEAGTPRFDRDLDV